MHILIILMIAIGLSMDAFSLSLAYGTLNISKKNMYQLTVIVGIYHLVMPLIGMEVGEFILSKMPVSPDILIFSVILFIGIQMIYESKHSDNKITIMTFKELLLFGLAVSLDSFSVGMGLDSISHHHYLTSILISLSSLVFTYLGLLLGKKTNNKIGSISTFIGGIILIMIGILYLF